MSCGEFIILGSTKLKENALVLHTISAEWGRRGFVVNVSRKTSGALYQILSIIDGEVVPNPRSELYRLRGVGTAYPLTSLRTDMRKSAITMFLGEVLYRTLTEGMVDSALFEWCKACVLTLEELRGDFSNFHLFTSNCSLSLRGRQSRPRNPYFPILPVPPADRPRWSARTGYLQAETQILP